MEIRTYREADFDRLVARWHETNQVSFPYLETERRHTLDDARSFFRRRILAECAVFVAEEDGTLLGLIALAGDWIRHLSVFPEHQRRGVGSRLLQTAKDRARRELRLYTFQRNRPARRFYEERGFQAVAFGTSPAPENEPDVEYLWLARPVSAPR